MFPAKFLKELERNFSSTVEKGLSENCYLQNIQLTQQLTKRTTTTSVTTRRAVWKQKHQLGKVCISNDLY